MHSSRCRMISRCPELPQFRNCGLAHKKAVQPFKRGMVPVAVNDYARCLGWPLFGPISHQSHCRVNRAHRCVAGHPCRAGCGATHDRFRLHRRQRQLDQQLFQSDDRSRGGARPCQCVPRLPRHHARGANRRRSATRRVFASRAEYSPSPALSPCPRSSREFAWMLLSSSACGDSKYRQSHSSLSR